MSTPAVKPATIQASQAARSSVEEYLHPHEVRRHGKNDKDQLSRSQIQRIRHHLNAIGFLPLNWDKSVYVNNVTGVTIAAWKDNLILFRNWGVEINKLKEEFKEILQRFGTQNSNPVDYPNRHGHRVIQI
jgi:hypothetical protein